MALIRTYRTHTCHNSPLNSPLPLPLPTSYQSIGTPLSHMAILATPTPSTTPKHLSLRRNASNEGGPIHGNPLTPNTKPPGLSIVAAFSPIQPQVK